MFNLNKFFARPCQRTDEWWIKSIHSVRCTKVNVTNRLPIHRGASLVMNSFSTCSPSIVTNNNDILSNNRTGWRATSDKPMQLYFHLLIVSNPTLVIKWHVRGLPQRMSHLGLGCGYERYPKALSDHTGALHRSTQRHRWAYNIALNPSLIEQCSQHKPVRDTHPPDDDDLVFSI